MLIISEAKEKIVKLWGEGKIQATEYRLFTYIIPAEVEGGTLFHHVVTGELIFLESDEVQHIQTLPCSYAPWMDELIKKHFLVKTELNDKNTVDTLRIALRTLETTNAITSYTILPTTHCNARCFYCYEAGIKHETMSDETADKLVDFMESHRAGKPLHIGWFGGEPLVGIRQIDRISSALNNKQIQFSSSMISNGYLFDENIIYKAKNFWHLKKIQITLDGTENIYNEIKAYSQCDSNPFAKVLNNISLLLKNGIHVIIRLNLGLHNADDLFELTKNLSDRYQNEKKLSIYAHLLYDDCGYEPSHLDNNELIGLYRKKELLDEYFYKCSLLKANNQLPLLKTYCCMSDNPTSTVILPSGMIGKCEHFTNSHTVGSIYEGITNFSEILALKEQVFTSNCPSCLLYPSCIKLKLCSPDRPCSDAIIGINQLENIHILQHFYENYQKALENDH